MIVVVYKPQPFIYLVIPKTGSTTMRRMIYSNWATQYETFSYSDMERDYEGYRDRWPNHPWFTSVRNPLSRAVSLWSEYRDRDIPGHASPEFRRYFELVRAADTFEKSLHDEELNAIGFWTRHTAMQSSLAMAPRIDGHLRLEHLEEDLRNNFLPRIGGQPAALLRARVGIYREHGLSWQEHYTPSCYGKVLEHVQGDFDYCLLHRLYSLQDLNDPCLKA